MYLEPTYPPTYLTNNLCTNLFTFNLHTYLETTYIKFKYQNIMPIKGF
jgi:hypothetical protein